MLLRDFIPASVAEFEKLAKNRIIKIKIIFNNEELDDFYKNYNKVYTRALEAWYDINNSLKDYKLIKYYGSSEKIKFYIIKA